MSEIGPLNWSDLGVSELVPTGTVTLLLADVEGSTWLWQTAPDEMTAAIANLDRTLAELVSIYHGVRPIEQGEGDSFVVAFPWASDAVACALALQRAPLVPIRLRIGLHTGEVQLRDESNYVGPTINRTGRLRSLAHGGQTVLSATTSDLVIDRLPSDAWLTDLGSHVVRDLPRPEHVMQLCHPDLRNEFPPLRTADLGVSQHLPVQLTSFVGRTTQIVELQQILRDSRLVTLTGAGGVGKTRLAVRVAVDVAADFGDGVWFVDLAPITDPELVPLTAARALGLPDQPGRTTTETLQRAIGDRHRLIVLDNCEHLLDATAILSAALLATCPGLTMLATSREPIGVAGELSWRVPSLTLDGEAVELFAHRARHARADFTITDENSTTVTEICRRLDGMPLAIELAAARVRALSVREILDGLHDRFRLLTRGVRTALRRQQTLRASVDWSYALLTDPERALFRRLAVFVGGFDLDAAEAVAADDEMPHHQVLDQLTLLVDKSLVVAENRSDPTRYRLWETVRQYALEKLGESGEADVVRSRHRDHYLAIARLLDTPTSAGLDGLIDRADLEIDNLRAAHVWSREIGDNDQALAIVSSLEPLWLNRGLLREGLTWIDGVLDGEDSHDTTVTPATWVKAFAARCALALGTAAPANMDQAQQALAIARELGDPDLIARALQACGQCASYSPDVAQPYFTEAIELFRASSSWWRLCQVRVYQCVLGTLLGDPTIAITAGEDGRDVADANGDGYSSLGCRFWRGMGLMMRGDLADAGAELRAVTAEADKGHVAVMYSLGLFGHGLVLALQGEADAARACARAALHAAAGVVGYEDLAYVGWACAALAAGDAAQAREASEAAWRYRVPLREVLTRAIIPMSEALLGCGDLLAARAWADDTVAMTMGWHRVRALTARARVAIAQGDPDQAERDAHEALGVATTVGSYVCLSNTFECLARLAADNGDHRHAVRLLTAADGILRRNGEVRFKVYQAGYESLVASVRDALEASDFDAASTEGAALSTEEAIAYAQRGRGERKRPTTGWGSLTPTERDVVRLVSVGLSNKEIGERLFVSPRTVQTHLTHVYTKLGFSSRVRLAQEASRLG
ncbi:putative ATPase/class 3 adenylate cyclase/DNA-binding CsgD family transcriptional regulator [Mycobacterium sp. AZCC_0083]|nr:putative ATPase/class 3 adenylate cyclase/DNA-binding CsgD family transcriptional regulator [Mycobacterium sp. AZCC_0083]